MPKTALFRCDAKAALGHLSRCIALADGLLEQGWTSAFAGAFDQTGQALLASTVLEHLPIAHASGSDEDALQTAAVAAKLDAALIVLDGYVFTPAYAESFRERGIPCAVIDDFAAWEHYPVDIVLNFTIAALNRHYPVGPSRLLLGPKYFPARATMRACRLQPRPPYDGTLRVCVALSGDTKGDKIAAVLRSLAPQKVHLRVLAAPTAVNRSWIEGALREMGAESRLRLIPSDISEDLAWADIVVCTGGMIKYEAIFLGAFPLILSNNAAEADDTRLWHAQGVGLDLGLISDLSEENFARKFADVLCGGLGALRAAAHRGQALFAEDPTLAAVQGLTAPVERTAP